MNLFGATIRLFAGWPPKLIITYHVRSQEADGYGQHGYVGPYHMGVSEVLPYKKTFWGEFTPLAAPGGGGMS